MTRLLITGANGYIGSRLLAPARREGLAVVAAVRRPDRWPAPPGVEVRPFDLRLPENADRLLEDVDAVVHLAAVLGDSQRTGDEDPNVSGTRQLLAAARRRRVRRFVLASSQSAAADSPTRYGRAKWACELLLTGDGECALRLGMISGGPPRGVFGQLYRLCKGFPVVPIICPNAALYPIHVDDLCAAILALVCSRSAPRRVIPLGPARAMRFDDYLRLVSRARLGLRLRLVRVPTALALLLARLSEWLPGTPAISRERVLGLLALRPMETERRLVAGEAEVELRDLPAALAAEGRRRLLLREGITLARYILGRRARPAVARRYARALLGEADGEPLALPAAAHRLPAVLRLFEPLPGPAAELWRRRLLLANRIVEMTPEAAPVFHQYRRRALPLSLLALAGHALLEALWLPWRLLRARRRAAADSRDPE